MMQRNDATQRRQCVLLDALLFRGAVCVYERALPWLCRAVLAVELQGDWRYEYSSMVMVASWRGHGWPPRAPLTASEGLGLLSSLRRSGPSPQIPSKGRVPGATPDQTRCLAVQVRRVAGVDAARVPGLRARLDLVALQDGAEDGRHLAALPRRPPYAALRGAENPSPLTSRLSRRR